MKTAVACMLTALALVSCASSGQKQALPQNGKASTLNGEIAPPYLSESRKEKFRNRFLNAPFPRAFALSKDGAFGGRWGKGMSLESVKSDALRSCRSKPKYQESNPCQLYMVNDQIVWQEQD